MYSRSTLTNCSNSYSEDPLPSLSDVSHTYLLPVRSPASCGWGTVGMQSQLSEYWRVFIDSVILDILFFVIPCTL